MKLCGLAKQWVCLLVLFGVFVGVALIMYLGLEKIASQVINLFVLPIALAVVYMVHIRR